MLANLLSSKPKTNLINLLLANPTRAFSFTELRVSSNCTSGVLKDALKELNKMDFLIVTVKNKIKYYQINRHFPLYPELVNFLRKVKKIPADLLAKSASNFKEAKMVVLTGVFIGKPRIETDVLFVGKINRPKLSRFLKNILENSPIIVIDKLKNKQKTPRKRSYKF